MAAAGTLVDHVLAVPGEETEAHLEDVIVFAQVFGLLVLLLDGVVFGELVKQIDAQGRELEVDRDEVAGVQLLHNLGQQILEVFYINIIH